MEWGNPTPQEAANLPAHGYTTSAAGGLSTAHAPSAVACIPGVFSVGEEFTCVNSPFVLSIDNIVGRYIWWACNCA